MNHYFLSFDEESEIKVDKNLDKTFDKLNLKNNDNEDIVLAYKDDLKINFTKNNDFNKMLILKNVMIFLNEFSQVFW